MAVRLRGRAGLIATVVALYAIVGTCQARGEPIRLLTPSTVVTDGGSELRLEPGVFLPEPDFQKLDDELRRLQVQETRLTAENQSLKESMTPSWYFYVGAFVAGAATAWALK